LSNFLIVRLGALGDIVHALPVAAALRQAIPDARIDWLVSAQHAALLALVPAVDGRVIMRDQRGTGGRSIPGVIGDLRRAGYEAAIDLQGLIKSAMIARLTGSRRVIGFAAPYLREPLARMAYTDTWNPGRGGMFDPRETRHVVEINLGLLTTLGIQAGSPVFPIDVPASEAADEVRRQTDGRYALVNPGAAWPNKRWPPDRLAAIARGLASRHALRSAVLWGPGERDLAEAVAAHAGGAAILLPATTIADVVALAREAAVMVSGDTGPAHIAAAIGTPVVGLYGPTRPERNGPYGAQNVAVSRASICACHHQRQCRRATMCLLEIGVEEVAAAVDRRLAAGASRG
jgi:lipopolysaccharide heptosyltransferase I